MKKYVMMVIVATLWITVTVIIPDFVDNPTNSVYAFFIVTSYVIATAGLSFIILYLTGLNKYVTAIFYPIYGLIGAIISYYRIGYKVVISPIILNCVFNATPSEVGSMVTIWTIVWGVANLMIGVGLVFWRWHLQTPQRVWIHILVAITIWGAYYHNNRLHSSLQRRFPMVLVKSIGTYWDMQSQKGHERTIPIYHCLQPIDSLNVVIVLGESQRADHWQLNGYCRATMPRMSKRTVEIVSLPHIYSQYTYTDASVPAIVTRADSLHPEYRYSECAFTTILQHQGYHTMWLSNGQIDDDYVCFAQACDTTIWHNAGKTPIVFDNFYDEELLPDLQAQRELPYAKKCIVMHCIGSHWYYNNHVPENYYQFQPITQERVVTYNTPQQVINSYDNTVYYLDHLLDTITQLLQNDCAVMFYLADHGEALGEEGNWLHANETDIVKNPACMVWFSQKFRERYPNKVQRLCSHQEERYLTDFFFHTILGLTGIQILSGDTIENKRLNLFNEE